MKLIAALALWVAISLSIGALWVLSVELADLLRRVHITRKKGD